MATLVKAFAALVAATLGTTAAVTHVPHPVHHRASALSVGQMAVDAPATIYTEMDLMHPRKPLYVAPPPPPPPAEPAAGDPAESAAPSGQAPVWSRPPALPPVAPPPVAIGSVQQAQINGDRAAAGLPQLAWSGCLAGVAYQNAARMAAAGAISHGNGVSADFGCGLGSARTGENVGFWSGGINDGQLNGMFMNSPGHRANIMGAYRYVGTAWVIGPNGAGYVAVEFG